MRQARPTRRKRQATVTTTQPLDKGRHFGATPPYSPLPDGLVDQVIAAAMELLEQSGVIVEPGGEASELLAKAGCEMGEGGLVRMPRSLIDHALSTVARGTRLWDRAGKNFLQIDGSHTWFFPGMTCIKVFDLESGEPRDSTRADLADMVRVADASPNIDGVCIGCKNVERSDIFGEIDEFQVMAENTQKPLMYLCENPASLDVVIDMAAAIRGGREALAQKPYFLHVITPLPLNFARIHSDQLIAAVRAGVPVSVGTLPIGGASSPMTVAGSLMHTLATDLAAIVLGQLVKPGSFCIGSSDVNFMEPASGSIGSFAQTSLADMAICQIRRRLNIPSLTSPTGASVARRFNQDAVWEISANMMQAFYHRPAICLYLGTLDQGLSYSLHALLMSDDMAGLLRKLWEGVAIDQERLALDLAKQVGPQGNFLGQQHSADFCRVEMWNSRYFGDKIPLSNSDRPDKRLIERIDDDLRRILANHKAEPLPADVQAELSDLQTRFAASFKAAA